MGLDSQGAQSTYVHGQMSCVHTSKKLELDLGSCPRSLTDFPHLVGFYFYLKLAESCLLNLICLGPSLLSLLLPS